MPVFFVKASSVGRDFSSSDTSMYWVQFDQLTTFSVSLMSFAAAAVCATDPEAVEPLPALPQAARAAVAPRPRAPAITDGGEVRPRSGAALRGGNSCWGGGGSAMGWFSSGVGAQAGWGQRAG